MLNERLAGLTLREIRTSVADRLRDTQTKPEAAELLNIFVQEGEQLFDAALPIGGGERHARAGARARRAAGVQRRRQPAAPVVAHRGAARGSPMRCGASTAATSVPG